MHFYSSSDIRTKQVPIIPIIIHIDVNRVNLLQLNFILYSNRSIKGYSLHSNPLLLFLIYNKSFSIESSLFVIHRHLLRLSSILFMGL
jgi:hypothetical protein